MSKLLMLRILPLLALTSPLTTLAVETSPILPMTLGQEYTGELIPSPENPHGEVCYKLAVQPDMGITLKVKTSGVGIVKFSVYDKTKALVFFHNDVSNQPQSDQNAPDAPAADSRFSFPSIGEASQLCLTTTNLDRGQRYDLTVTGKPVRPKSPLALRPVAINELTAPTTNKPVADPPTTTKPPAVPTMEIPPPPMGEPYCYVGTWQIADLSAYWLPSIQNFTQAKITEPQLLGYAKVTINKDGYASFEAFDLEQKYTLRSKETGARIDRIGLSLSGNSNARFQVNPDSTLTFNHQNYQRLTTKLNLGSSLKLTGDRLLMLFGDRDLPPIKLPYRCLDRENMILRVPLPTGQKLIPIALKRIS